jgi:DNA-binding transcriptional LysR family regulator
MIAREADWNDWRYFLEVARSGSTLAAGRTLRVSQTTVARRVAALEEALGSPLFERRPAGYALTDAGSSLVTQAEAIETAALAAQESARARQRQASGTVRLTTEEIFASCLIAPHLRDLHERFPKVRIEFDTTMAVRDLGTGEADIALRSTRDDQPAGLVGRVICWDGWTLYCSRDYAARHGVPASIEDLQNHQIIGGGGGGLAREYGEWLEQAGLTHRVTMEQGSATGLLTAVRTGIGIAVLPCIVADAEPDLIRCAPPPRDEERHLWLLTHERVRHDPAVRAVIDFLYARLSAHVHRLEEQPEAA